MMAALKAAMAADEHETVLRLTGSSDTAQAKQAKLVALVKLERYDEILSLLAKGDSNFQKQCALEYAYALYKKGDLTGAEKVLQTSEDQKSLGLQHMMAQVAYRAERFDEAVELYAQLLDQERDTAGAREVNDLDVNLAATYAQLIWQGRGDLAPKSDALVADEHHLFELEYNNACGAIARGDLPLAQEMLKKARKFCESVEYLSDEEKQAEVVPILSQQIYVCSRLGQLEEAQKLQDEMAQQDISDTSITIIIENNLLTFHNNKNPYLVQRRTQPLPTRSNGHDRIFDFQHALLKRNRAVADLNTQKFNGARLSSTATDKEGSSSTTSTDQVNAGIINAAAAAKLRADKSAVEKLQLVLDSRPNDVGLVLTIIQMYMQTHNSTAAVHQLESFFDNLEAAKTPTSEEVRFAPGLVALAVSLYQSTGRRAAVRTELAKAAAFWTKQPSKQANRNLLQAAGFELSQSSNPSDTYVAGDAFSQLVQLSNKPSREVSAGLVAAYATTDYQLTEPHHASLEPIDSIIASIDVDALIEKGVPAYPARAPQQPTSLKKKRKRTAADDGTSQPPAIAIATTAESTIKKSKSTTKSSIPAPTATTTAPGTKPLDPERWLPMRDRSYYRPKGGKKAKKRAMDATQGGFVAGSTAESPAAVGNGGKVKGKSEGETLELVGGAGSIKVEKAPGNTGGGGGGGGKKKKGKR